MKIEMKNYKAGRGTAFTAQIIVDGVLAFNAKDEGVYSGTDFYKAEGGTLTEAEVNAWLAVNTPQKIVDGRKFDNALAFVINDLIERVECEQQVCKLMKTRVLAFKKNGQMVGFRGTKADLPALQANNPSLTFLDGSDAMFQKAVDFMANAA